MLKCSASLWAANLSRLAREIERVQRYTDRFHFDVTDGHYLPDLMFSPRLVRSLRSVTKLPFEVHLMVSDPLPWIAPFAEAGADAIIFDLETAARPGDVLKAIKSKQKSAGLALTIGCPVSEIGPYWKDLDLLVVAGVPWGDEQSTFASAAVEKVQLARESIFEHRWNTMLAAEGGIVHETVPLLKSAGLDYIVAGSLLFDGSPRKLRQWLDEL